MGTLETVGAEVAEGADRRAVAQRPVAGMTLVVDERGFVGRVDAACRVVGAVVLVEVGAGGHVDDVLHRGAVQAGAGELGCDLGDELIG